MAFAHSIRGLKVTLSRVTHIVGSIENISPVRVLKQAGHGVANYSCR